MRASAARARGSAASAGASKSASNGGSSSAMSKAPAGAPARNASASACTTVARSTALSTTSAARIAATCFAPLSTKVTCAAPRDSASRPRAPLPAKRSRQRALSITGASQSNRVCRTRSGVGRTLVPGSNSTMRLRNSPPMMRRLPGARFTPPLRLALDQVDPAAAVLVAVAEVVLAQPVLRRGVTGRLGAVLEHAGRAIRVGLGEFQAGRVLDRRLDLAGHLPPVGLFLALVPGAVGAHVLVAAAGRLRGLAALDAGLALGRLGRRERVFGGAAGRQQQRRGH